MANHLKMAEVQAIQALHGRGWSQRRIACELGIHRETVQRYMRLAEAASKPANLPAGYGVSKSAVSRVLVGAARDSLRGLCERRIDALGRLPCAALPSA